VTQNQARTQPAPQSQYQLFEVWGYDSRGRLVKWYEWRAAGPAQPASAQFVYVNQLCVSA
jgi:hypothetical protein